MLHLTKQFAGRWRGRATPPGQSRCRGVRPAKSSRVARRIPVRSGGRSAGTSGPEQPATNPSRLRLHEPAFGCGVEVPYWLEAARRAHPVQEHLSALCSYGSAGVAAPDGAPITSMRTRVLRSARVVRCGLTAAQRHSWNASRGPDVASCGAMMAPRLAPHIQGLARVIWVTSFEVCSVPHAQGWGSGRAVLDGRRLRGAGAPATGCR